MLVLRATVNSQVRKEARVGSNEAEPSVGAQENVLGDVIAIGDVRQQVAHDAEDGILMAYDQVGERSTFVQARIVCAKDLLVFHAPLTRVVMTPQSLQRRIYNHYLG